MYGNGGCIRHFAQHRCISVDKSRYLRCYYKPGVGTRPHSSVGKVGMVSPKVARWHTGRPAEKRLFTDVISNSQAQISPALNWDFFFFFSADDFFSWCVVPDGGLCFFQILIWTGVKTFVLFVEVRPFSCTWRLRIKFAALVTVDIPYAEQEAGISLVLKHMRNWRCASTLCCSLCAILLVFIWFLVVAESLLFHYFHFECGVFACEQLLSLLPQGWIEEIWVNQSSDGARWCNIFLHYHRTPLAHFVLQLPPVFLTWIELNTI